MKARMGVSVLSKAQQTAMLDEINRQKAEIEEDMRKNWFSDIDAMILYVLHEEFGFGEKRLRKFYKCVKKYSDDMADTFLMDDVQFVGKCKLKNLGIDVDEIRKEVLEFNEDFE